MIDDDAHDALATLLWEAGNPHPDPDRIGQALDAEFDRSRLVALAINHRMAALVWRVVKLSGHSDKLGVVAATQLEQCFELGRYQERLLFPHVLAKVLDPLEAIDLQPLVMRGPALARKYPESGLRPMDDLDVLVVGPDHARAVCALEAQGWTQRRHSGMHQYDVVLTHPEIPMPLEVHYGLEAWHERTNSLRPQQLYAARQSVWAYGRSWCCLPVEEELLACAIHAGKPFHGFDRLIWLADLAMAIDWAERHGGVDWPRLAYLAKRARASTVVAVALHMSARCGVKVPEVIRVPERGWRADAVERMLHHRWPLEGELRRLHLRYALVETNRYRAALFIGHSRHKPLGERLGWSARAGLDALRRLRGVPAESQH